MNIGTICSIIAILLEIIGYIRSAFFIGDINQTMFFACLIIVNVIVINFCQIRKPKVTKEGQLL